MGGPAIGVRGLHKRFPQNTGYRGLLTFWRNRYTTALEGIDLEVSQGEIFGLLGANGAGKTTLLKILAGLVVADRGSVVVSGRDLTRAPRLLKEHLTYVPGEERSLYWRLTGGQNLRLFAALYEVPRREVDRRVGEVLQVVGLEDAADRRVADYSTGMRQRLSIARGLLADTPTLLLDEPTRGVDPAGARHLWGFIREELVEARGRTVVLATHNMEEAAALCHRVAVLHRGRVRACGGVGSLAGLTQGPRRYRVEVAGRDGLPLEELSRLPGVVDLRPSPPNGHDRCGLDLAVEDPDAAIPRLVHLLALRGGRVLEVRRVEPSLGEAIAALGREG